MAANTDTLNKMHELVANHLIERLESGEASPQEVAQALKMLKDNGIQAIPVKNSPLANLMDKMPFSVDEDGVGNIVRMTSRK